MFSTRGRPIHCYEGTTNYSTGIKGAGPGLLNQRPVSTKPLRVSVSVETGQKVVNVMKTQTKPLGTQVFKTSTTLLEEGEGIETA
jgi:hypothetical protein